MRTKLIIPILLILCIGTACQKQTEPEGEDMHPFTEQELKKKQLDTAASTFFEYLQPETVDDPLREILANSRFYVPYLGMLRYKYIKDGITLITIDVTHDSFTVDLKGGLHMEGNRYGDSEVYVFYQNQRLATLGLFWYEGIPTPVFRFDDGTSYAITTTLLVDSLIDYLLENVFSTE